MRRVSFEIPADALDALCDGILIELPHGLRTVAAGEGRRRIEAVALAEDMPDRAAFEAAAGVPLDAWAEGAAPADAAERRAAIRGGILIEGRLLIRGPADPAPEDADIVDIVIERSPGGFGTGTHPTTRMCLELLLELPAVGGLGDLGCGLGVLAIVAARLGYKPVSGLDRDAGALAVARVNAERSGVRVEFVEADLGPDTLPQLQTLVLNAPPDMHQMVAGALPEATQLVVASGLPLTELDEVLTSYRAAGLVPVVRREDNVWGAAVLIRGEALDG